MVFGSDFLKDLKAGIDRDQARFRDQQDAARVALSEMREMCEVLQQSGLILGHKIESRRNTTSLIVELDAVHIHQIVIATFMMRTRRVFYLSIYRDNKMTEPVEALTKEDIIRLLRQNLQREIACRQLEKEG